MFIGIPRTAPGPRRTATLKLQQSIVTGKGVLPGADSPELVPHAGISPVHQRRRERRQSPTSARCPATSGGPGWRLGGHVRSSVRDCQCGLRSAHRPCARHFSSPLFAVPDRVLHVGFARNAPALLDRAGSPAGPAALQLGWACARDRPGAGLGSGRIDQARGNLSPGPAGFTRACGQKPEGSRETLALRDPAVLGKIAVMAPWVVRNYLVYGTFVLHVPVEGVAFAGRVPVDFISPEVIAARQEYRLAIPVVEGMPVWPATHRIPILPAERYVLEINRKLKSLGMTNFKTDKITQLLNRARHVNALWGYPAAWWDHWGVEVPRLLAIVWYACYLALLGFLRWESSSPGTAGRSAWSRSVGWSLWPATWRCSSSCSRRLDTRSRRRYSSIFSVGWVRLQFLTSSPGGGVRLQFRPRRGQGWNSRARNGVRNPGEPTSFPCPMEDRRPVLSPNAAQVAEVTARCTSLPVIVSASSRNSSVRFVPGEVSFSPSSMIVPTGRMVGSNRGSAVGKNSLAVSPAFGQGPKRGGRLVPGRLSGPGNKLLVPPSRTQPARHPNTGRRLPPPARHDPGRGANLSVLSLTLEKELGEGDDPIIAFEPIPSTVERALPHSHSTGNGAFA